VMTFQVDVFWVATPCSVVVVHQRFECPCCLFLQGEVLELLETKPRGRGKDMVMTVCYRAII
jgi:hypothetical protein